VELVFVEEVRFTAEKRGDYGLYGYGLSTNRESSFSSDQVVESTQYAFKFISRKTRRHETRSETISKASKQNEDSIFLEFCLLSEKKDC